MSENKHFAVCVRNTGYEGTLELRKLYEIIGDPSAEKHNQVRVIDESGEDYLYPKSWFHPVELPAAVEEQLINLVEK
ncbi:MAG TPA: hypothetical protein VII12_03880 [Thermoanaerobaculia bacterium]|jgi:hypothetical protein